MQRLLVALCWDRELFLMVNPDRVLALSGGRNFRDLGGYPSADGRQTKWRHVYRSGVMASLTEADYRRLDELGIKVICDLRTTAERAAAPFANTGSIKPLYRSWDYAIDPEAWSGLAEMSSPAAADLRSLMMKNYAKLPWQFVDQFRAVFEHLAKSETPLIFNCAGGKDRTGIAAALLLTALGVPRETVIEDYALTERVVDFERISTSSPEAKREAAAAGFSFLSNLPREVQVPVIRSDPDYLRHSFEALEAREGSVMAFIKNRLGIDDQMLAGIRNHLLE
jgi:protein-tyrosine phosphatase